MSTAANSLTHKPVHGKVVKTSSLLGKDVYQRGSTFTARMLPKISKGQTMELSFKCSDLVHMFIARQFGKPKVETAPSAFLQVWEKIDDDWIDVGRTESVPNSSNPAFTRSVIVTYKGGGNNQRIRIDVFTHAHKLRNGVFLGCCEFLLEDLVHARTARVMKLPLMSKDKERCNGNCMINGIVHHQVEDGIWMQLHLIAEHLPSGVSNESVNNGASEVYFEIWRLTDDDVLKVYQSEKQVTVNAATEWWPLAISGKRIGETANSIIVVKLLKTFQGSSEDAQVIGEIKMRIGDCKRGLRAPIVSEGRSIVGAKVYDSSTPFVEVKDLKWIRINQGSSLATHKGYQTDVEFMQQLMNEVDLDAGTKEEIDNAINFVQGRSMFWAMTDLLEFSTPVKVEPKECPPDSPLARRPEYSHKRKQSRFGSSVLNRWATCHPPLPSLSSPLIPLSTSHPLINLSCPSSVSLSLSISLSVSVSVSLLPPPRSDCPCISQIHCI